MHGGQTARRLEHLQSTQERGLTIEALAHQAHVSAAWLGEEFENGQACATATVRKEVVSASARPAAGVRRPAADTKGPYWNAPG